MKKGMSKVLSIVLSAAMVSSMIGMNSVSAVVLTEQEVLEGFSTICSYRCNPLNSVSKDGIHVDIELFIAKIIDKLNNFLYECSGQTLQNPHFPIIKGIMEYMGPGGTEYAVINDLRLYHLDILAGGLSNVSRDIFSNNNKYELSKHTIQLFSRFEVVIQNMAYLVDNLSQRDDIPEDDRIKFVQLIDSIIEKMTPSSIEELNIRYIQDIAFRTDLSQRYIPGSLFPRSSLGCTLL